MDDGTGSGVEWPKLNALMAYELTDVAKIGMAYLVMSRWIGWRPLSSVDLLCRDRRRGRWLLTCGWMQDRRRERGRRRRRTSALGILTCWHAVRTLAQSPVCPLSLSACPRRPPPSSLPGSTATCVLHVLPAWLSSVFPPPLRCPTPWCFCRIVLPSTLDRQRPAPACPPARHSLASHLLPLPIPSPSLLPSAPAPASLLPLPSSGSSLAVALALASAPYVDGRTAGASPSTQITSARACTWLSLCITRPPSQPDSQPARSHHPYRPPPTTHHPYHPLPTLAFPPPFPLLPLPLPHPATRILHPTSWHPPSLVHEPALARSRSRSPQPPSLTHSLRPTDRPSKQATKRLFLPSSLTSTTTTTRNLPFITTAYANPSLTLTLSLASRIPPIHATTLTPSNRLLCPSVPVPFSSSVHQHPPFSNPSSSDQSTPAHHTSSTRPPQSLFALLSGRLFHSLSSSLASAALPARPSAFGRALSSPFPPATCRRVRQAWRNRSQETASTAHAVDRVSACALLILTIPSLRCSCCTEHPGDAPPRRQRPRRATSFRPPLSFSFDFVS